MGQNSSKEGGLGYSGYISRDFFARQVEFYRWRADPLLNTHIARVSFQLQAAVHDRQRLQRFLTGPTANGDYLSLEELAALGQGKGQYGKELMSFEQYICTLGDLRGRLGLGETLYALQAMLGGYEVLLGKVGRVRAEPECCFVTKEGEVRVWISRDYRSNETDEGKGEDSCIVGSEMGLIKKALEVAEELASNHTEFLHFGRQFRSCMERDILQNWNFVNSRKLVNGYAYTYKLSLPTSLKDALVRWTPSSMTTPLSSQTSYQSSRVQSSYKEEMVSTCSVAIKQQVMTEGKRETPRPLSHSDYSHSKPSSEFSHATVKTHSKKFSSTDLKNLNERGKACESPKMSRSELIPNKLAKPADSTVPTQRFRREREYAVAGEKGKEEVRFSPMANTFMPSPALSGFHSVINDKEKATIKHSQREGRKKLEKKVGTASKYAHFHQNESRTLNTNEQTSRVIPEGKKPIVHFVCDPPQKEDLDTFLTHTRNKHSDPTLVHNHSYQPIPPKDPPLLQRGRTEVNHSHHSDCSQQNTFSYPRGCITIKTVNNLLQNNEVSLHESNGSFMSVGQSQGSQYHGMLCQMGRSVDILNLPSSKQVMARKPNGSNAPINHLNRSNC